MSQLMSRDHSVVREFIKRLGGRVGVFEHGEGELWYIEAVDVGFDGADENCIKCTIRSPTASDWSPTKPVSFPRLFLGVKVLYGKTW